MAKQRWWLGVKEEFRHQVHPRPQRRESIGELTEEPLTPFTCADVIEAQRGPGYRPTRLGLFGRDSILLKHFSAREIAVLRRRDGRLHVEFRVPAYATPEAAESARIAMMSGGDGEDSEPEQDHEENSEVLAGSSSRFYFWHPSVEEKGEAQLIMVHVSKK